MRFFVFHQEGSVGYYIAMTALVISVVTSVIYLLSSLINTPHYSGETVPQSGRRKVSELSEKEMRSLVKDSVKLYAVFATVGVVLFSLAYLYHYFYLNAYIVI